MGCIGTLIGLLDAQRTGKGRRIDVAMMDSLLFIQENLFSVFLDTGEVPRRNGNRYPEASPIRDFTCKDKVPIMLNIATDNQWEKLARALGHEEWLSVPEFSGMRRRTENYLLVEDVVQEAVGQFFHGELERILQAHGCAYGRINDYEQVRVHPQVRHRGMIVNARYPDGTVFRVPGNPLHVNGVERQDVYPVAPLGRDTMEVLGEVEERERLVSLMEPVLKAVERKTEELYQ